MLPATAALILHFRDHARSARCLRSLLDEGVPRALVVDNSEDGGISLNALSATLSDLAGTGMEVELFSPGRNLGFAAGVNRGLAEIRTRFGRCAVLLINSDARALPGMHSQLRHAVGSGSSLAGPVQVTPHGEVIGMTYYHRLSGLLLTRPSRGAMPYLSGCCLLVDPDLAERDLFDEDFFFYGEDAELSWRLARRGAVVTLVSSAEVAHEPSSGSCNGSLFYEYHVVRAHWLLAQKTSNRPMEALSQLVVRCAILPLRAALRCWRTRSAVPIVGFLLATLDRLAGRRRALTPPPT